MGAAEAVPFGTEPPARAFAAAHGGRVVRLDEIPDDYVLGWTPPPGDAPPTSRTGISRPTRHERPARPPAAADHRHRRRACPAGRRRPGDTRDHVALAGLGAGRRIRRSCWLIPTARQPSQAIAACRAEITRLERIFSLYRADSALSQLNRQGRLEAPPLELVELLAFSARVSAATGGAFDVTVQPLWDLYAGHFADPAADPAGPSEAALAATLALVDWRAVEIDPARIGFRRPGMAVTLNGVAQGYITDRVADLLRGRGFDNVLVELGEIRALGRHPDGRPGRPASPIPNDPSAVLLELPLPDVALATSGGYGTWFDPGHRHHHLFDPATGRSAAHHAARLGHCHASNGRGRIVHGT